MLTQNHLASPGTPLLPTGLARAKLSGRSLHFPRGPHLPSPALSLLFSRSFYCKYVRTVEGEPFIGVSTEAQPQVRGDDLHLWDPAALGSPWWAFLLFTIIHGILLAKSCACRQQSLIFLCMYLEPETEDTSTSWFAPESERSAVTADLGCL